MKPKGLFFKWFTYDRVYQCVSPNIVLQGHRPPAVPVDLVLLFPQHTRWNLGEGKGLGLRFAIELLMTVQYIYIYAVCIIHVACRDTKKIHIQSCIYMHMRRNSSYFIHILHHRIILLHIRPSRPFICTSIRRRMHPSIHQHMHTSAHRGTDTHTHTHTMCRQQSIL